MEEKIEKIQRTTKSSSTISSHDNDTSQSDHIPLDLTIEILSRLPAKSIGRFRSVSNLWSAITTSQDFISSFATRSLASRPSVLLTVKKGNMLLFFSSPLHKNSFDGSLSCLGSYRYPKFKFHRYHYVHGLVFLEGSKQLVVWNPTVRRFFTLPEPEGTECDRGYWIVGYDSIEGKYIVLFDHRDSKIYILTLGAQGQRSSTIITNSFPMHRPTTEPCGRCIDGVMYYGATVSGGVDNFEHCIMSFDVRSKKLNKITYPEGYSLVNCYVGCDMVPYEGRLAIVETTKFPCIDLWILKNGDRHEWTHKHFVLPLSEMDPIRSQMFFFGVSDAGELIFAQGWLSQSFINILYFDPRRKSISREVSFNVGDEDRCRYGLDKDSRYNINIYPNHIQSLVSL